MSNSFVPDPRPKLDRAAQAKLAEAFNLANLSSEFYANPYSTYDALRRCEPIKQMPDGSLFLTRYADLQTVYRDALSFSSDKRREFKPKYGDSPLFEHHTNSLVFNDPPLHSRVRTLIAGALTGRAINALQDGLIRLVDHLLDQIDVKAKRGNPVDLIADFASAIPVEVIGNLLAIPHPQREPLREWSLAILGALEPRLTDQQLKRGNDAVLEFKTYLTQLVAQRRASPGDPAQDVLTRLIQGERADSAAQLSETELLHNCIFILNAGHETTTNLIGNALVLLDQWPRARADLLASFEIDSVTNSAKHPSSSSILLDSAIEEFLRFESSNQLGNRLTVCDTRIGDLIVKAGTPVTLCIGAANRDPAQFVNPDQLDIRRMPNRHLAFGFGIHQCVGLSLARLEAKIALGRFLTRFPNYSIVGVPQRGGRVRFRGFLSISASV
jgi:cytochrome P450